jgi:hypothetical protein
MTSMAFADHASRFEVERREQRGRPVTDVVMGPRFDVAEAHGQQRLGAIERLNLRLLIDAQHQGTLRRGHVEPDDVADLFDEQRIFRQLEGADAVRLEGEGARSD